MAEARPFEWRQLDELARALTRPDAASEFGILVLCLMLAWAVVRLMRGRTVPADSVWYGQRVIDGVLFPVLALTFALAARAALVRFIEPAVFRIAIPILLSLVVIRLSARVLRRTFPSLLWVGSIERSISWLAWLAVVLWVTGVSPVVLDAMNAIRWNIGSATLTLRNVVEGTFTAGLVIVLVLWVSGAIERKLLANATGQDLSLRKIAATLVRAALLSVGLMVALTAVGIDLTALSVVGGAIGVGIGFGLQKIAANYISGFVILAERSLRIGDMVRLDAFEGRITDIRTRYTVIRSLAGRESLVPNETLITQRIENLSLADPRLLVQTTVQVPYGTDVRALQPKLRAAIGGVSRVIDDPAPNSQLSAFASDGMELTINFWIRDAENGQMNVRSDVNLAVLDVLNAEGIDIPFPQRVVHAAVPSDAPRDLSKEAPRPAK